LRERLDLLAREHGRPRAWLIVEKILLKGETLPQDWGCDGTTGYDFMDEVNALQHDPAGEAVLAKSWTRLSGRPAGFADEELMARREIVARSFSAQLEACAAAWQDIVGDLVPRPTLRRLLAEFLAHVPVYRTYGTGEVLSEHDSEILREVAAKAAKSCLATDRWAVEPLLAAMVTPQSTRGSWPRALARFQQLSAPVAAKSVEDTGFYRYGRLLSRNDVGFDIGTFSLGADAFHARMQRRRADYPRTMLATATHDHKRGEDVRARLAVVSECADEWAGLLSRWIDATSSPLSPGDRAMLLQMVVGAWPLDLHRDDEAGRTAFAERLWGWQQKALREAKLESDWAAVNASYEEAARAFILRLVAEAAMPDLLDALLAFVRRIAPAGAVNGLAQCLLKLTVPGVPDIYQGTDLWDFSLVDPDNRRPVDFAARTKVDGAPLRDLVRHWRDGRIKQALMRRALVLRQRAPRLFTEGSYEPVEVEGPLRQSVVAFVRRAGDDWLLVAVPRLALQAIAEEGGLAFRPDAWSRTSLRLQRDTSTPAHDVLRGCSMDLSSRPGLDLLWSELPVTLLSSVSPD
jgi:(1->4)-alpha-D-glucan 1-alpha-D-glucosylmutase